MYNIRWPTEQNSPDWEEELMPIFDQQTKRFKINLSHSFILHNKSTQKYRHFHASHNNARVFDFPRQINNQEDFAAFLSEMNNMDVLEHAKQQRPDSKWTVHSVTSTSFYLNPLTEYPIGCCDHPLPDFIRDNQAIYTLIKDENHHFEYTDNLCFFRCLALHQGSQRHALQTHTAQLFKQWLGSQNSLPSDFPGITYSDLERAEDMFKVNVDVFEFDETQTPPCLVPSRRSARKYSQTMRVLCYEQHFCYITNINKAAHAFGCSKCGKLWKLHKQLNRHEKTCTGDKIKHVYPGGVYTPPPTPLETLQKNGLLIDSSYVYPYRATYDFEVFFESQDLPQPKTQDAKTIYTSKHVPLSVSVCSNVPTFDTPVCFISDGNPQDLVNKMIDHLELISDHAYRLLREEFVDVFDQLDQREMEEEKEDGESTRTGLTTKQLRQKLDGYLHELPVVGFNSSNYDLNVIKPYFFQRVANLTSQTYKESSHNTSNPEDEKEEDKEDEEEEDKEDEEEKGSDRNKLKFIFKSMNQYKCVSTDKLKFLDITSFIAPGFSYTKYLAAFDVKEQKGFFPYEFVTDLEKLNLPYLPPKEAFFSSLKNEHICEQDYHYCQDIWKKLDMKTLRDFLIWYNDKDVVPFLQALDKQSRFYQTLGLDMLKDGIGVPGLTLRYLFKTLPTDVYFSLFHEKHSDLHQLLRSEMVGGPSIIFHRYHEKGLTAIRQQDGKTVSCLEGYDANALYLWALMQDMPTEDPIRRRKENHFKAEKINRFGQLAREWMEWTMHSHDIHLQHMYNGKEQSLGKRRIRVDGWDADTKTVYQFHGCLFHGHVCCKTQGKTINPINGKTLTELRQNTEEITNYLRDTVKVTVIEKWECEWEQEKRTNPSIEQFLDKYFPRIKNNAFRGLGEITCGDIVRAVENGNIFGLVQCDIRVPDHLQDYFSEMPPVFKNAEISRADVGEFMRNYAEKHKILSQPRKTLIGSFFGKNILLTTPLLQWYLRHGLEVLDVQQVVEYRPQKCFQQFGETVSNARRQGDLDPSKAILADTFKLLGNSAYGKTITNISKHTDVTYTDELGTRKLVNNSLFKKLTPLTENVFEVETAKSKLNWNLPLQIGFFVYQYAKLRMLQFHFDFVDRFLSRKDYQLCEMDTDSLYMALSTSTFEEAVKPNKKTEFYKEWPKWFPSQACNEHQTDFISCRLSGKTWIPPPCCIERQTYDKRTPGLFKLEFKGEGIIALCSKTYYCFGEEEKYSCKGLSKRQNDITKNSYLQVLQTQTSGGGKNKSFRTLGNAVYTYQQQRDALSFFYIKRRVQQDGISTKPLFI